MKNAQQSVHWTGGYGARLQTFSFAQTNSAKMTLSCLSRQPVTHTVRQFIAKYDWQSMAVENLQRAKAIFFHYACNHFFLDREVDAKEYERFNISREQEYQWRQEYISYWLSQLSVDDFQALEKLNHTYAGEALREMIRMSELGDSLAKLRYANAMWNIASGGIMFSIVRARAKRKAMFLWKYLLKNPVELTEDHRKQISKIIEDQTRIQKSVRARTPEDYILNYAKNKLADVEKKRLLLLSAVRDIIKITVDELIGKIKKWGKRKGWKR